MNSAQGRLRFGLRQRRARRWCHIQRRQPAGLAFHPQFDLAQRTRANQLRIDQRHQVAFGGEAAISVGMRRFGAQFCERLPRHLLQKLIQDSILLAHGMILPGFGHVAQRSEPRISMPCTGEQPSSKKRAGQPWHKPGHDPEAMAAPHITLF